MRKIRKDPAIFEGGDPSFDYALLLLELKRVERLTYDKFGIDLVFSDERSGRLLWNLAGLRAGVFFARKQGRGPWSLSLRFNSAMIRSVGQERFLPTIAHEYAHAVVHFLKTRRKRGTSDDFSAHGALWRALMELYGHSPERCHEYPAVSARRRAMHAYQCGHCRKEYTLGAIRHSRLEKRPGYLVCGSCRGPLLHRPGDGAGS
jgi:predicted SprT family Zn-dependent metalloprotease